MGSRVGFVGRGRVGGALAHALGAAGHEIVAQVGRGESLEALAQADIVIISVPDDALPWVAAAVADVVDRDALLIHTSGAQPLSVLGSHGDRIGILHPATPVASAEQPLGGVTFGVVATELAEPALVELVEAIGGVVHRIAPGSQVSYHAALVHASNHLVALIADAASMLDGDLELLVPLLRRTLDNVASLGPEQALTGPVVRGDAETVRAHLRAVPEPIRASYRENARRALALAIRSGRLDPEAVKLVEAALDEPA